MIEEDDIHDDLFTLDQIDNRYRSNSTMLDFKIVYIDMTKNNE